MVEQGGVNRESTGEQERMSRDAEKTCDQEKEGIGIECKKGKWTNLIVEVHKERRNGAGNEAGSAGNEQG